MTRALVTGAAGFIGSHVVADLLRAGHRVRAMLLPGEDARNLDQLDVERVEADVRDPAALGEAVAGCEVVFHLASIYAVWARDPALFDAVNVEGTRNLLDAARAAGVERVIVTTSQAVWAGNDPDTVITEATEPDHDGCLARTGDLYCATKLAVHRLCLERAATGQDVVMVAPAVPFGPGDLRPTPTGQILTSVVNMPAFTYVESVINPIDVRDVARGHLLAWERGRAGESYLLGGSDNVGMADIIDAVREGSGTRRLAFKVPYALAASTAHLLTWWANHVTHRPPLIAPGALRVARLGFRLDCKKARDELGLEPRPWQVSVNDALRWFADNGYLSNRRARRHLANPPRSLSGRATSFRMG